MKGVSLIAPPDPLEVDLTEREFKFVNRAGKTKKILEPKEDFKKRTKRSPDDGDGLVLSLGPDYCFQNVTIELVSSLDVMPETQKTTVDELSRVLGL